MSESADNVSKRSATSPTRTGTPNGKTPPRSFSPAPVINSALEAVREMSEAKLKGAEPKTNPDILLRKAFLGEEAALPVYPDDPCERCKPLRQNSKDYCVIGGGKFVKGRCARCVMAGASCSFNLIRKTNKKTPSKAPMPAAGLSRPTSERKYIKISDSNSQSDDSKSGSDKEPVSKIDKMLAKMEQMFEEVAELRKEVRKLRKTL